ncbi:MAG: polysaccharide biosynthesis tyrosine autokinase [Fibrobacteraceae bacterium]
MDTDLQNVNKVREADDEIDLMEVLSILVARWKLLAVFAVVGLFGGVVCMNWIRPQYQSDAMLQVDLEGSKAGLAIGDMGALLDMPSPSDAEIELMKSRMVLSKVVEEEHLCYSAVPTGVLDRLFHREGRMDLQLFDTPEAAVGKKEKWSAEVIDSLHFALLNGRGESIIRGRTGELYKVPYEGDTVRFSVLRIKARPGQRFLLSETDSLLAERALAEHLDVSEKGKKTGVIQLTYKNQYPDKAAAVLNAVANAYVRQNVEMHSAEAEKTLTFLESQLPALRMKLDSSEQKLTAYRYSVGSVDLSSEARMVLEKQVDLQKQLLALEQQKKEQSKLFTPDHPTIQTIDQQEAQIRTEMNKVGASTKELPLTQQEVMRLKGDVALNDTLYTTVLNNIQQLRIVRAGQVGSARIVDHASLEVLPVSPRRTLIFAGFFAGALLLGCGLVFLLRLGSSRGEKCSSEIEKETGVSVYAKVPEAKKNDPDELADEAVRTLRTALEFSCTDRNMKVLMVTGLIPSVGKSYISKRLSVLFGQTNKKVLLIDADLRKGKLRSRRESGLSEVLYGHAAVKDVLHSLKDCPNVMILGAGSVPSNPAELLGSDVFRQVVNEVKSQFDLVIIDTPPLLLVTDPQWVARLADFRLIVLRYGAHDIDAIREGLRMLELTGKCPTAFVMNRCVYEGGRGSYQYGYGYRYGYGHYGYGTGHRQYHDDGTKKNSQCT